MSLITVYEDVLKPALVADYFEVLIGDCKAAFDIKSLNSSSSSSSSSNVNSGSYSVGSTYFIRANEIPVCNLERLVKEIYSFHTAGIECDTSSSGAEWWTQVIDSRDDIGFHWDRDYELEESEGVHVYPIKSTVTYLSDCGAPTMIVDKRGTADSSYELIGVADTFSLCKPKVGRSIVFDGSLLHAAPSGIDDENDEDESQSDSDDDDEEEEEEEEDDDVERRVTLLVNVWIDHIPHQAKRFEQLSPAALTTTIPEDLLHLCWKRLAGQEDDQSCSDLELLCSSSSCSRMKRWKFNNTGTNYTIEVPLPPVNQLTDRLIERGSLTVRYGVEDSTSTDDKTDEHKDSSNDCKIRIAYSKHQPVDHSEDEEDEGDDDEHDEDDHDVDADEEDGDEDVAVIEESKPKRTRY